VVKKVRVELHGISNNRGVKIDADATDGAVIGTNLYWSDGTLVTADEIQNVDPDPDPVVYPTTWDLILEQPDVITGLEGLEGDGFIVFRDDDDSYRVRSITGEPLRIGVTNGNGLAADPVIDLGPLPTIRNRIETGEDYTIPANHQMLVWDDFILDGGSLTLEGELVILGDEAPQTYITKGINYALTADDYMVESTAAGLTFTLPLADGKVGKSFILKNGSTGDLTVEGTFSETIDDGLTAVLSDQYESITVVSDGTGWRIV
jgi:hypothetical protein